MIDITGYLELLPHDLFKYRHYLDTDVVFAASQFSLSIAFQDQVTNQLRPLFDSQSESTFTLAGSKYHIVNRLSCKRYVIRWLAVPAVIKFI